MTDSRAIFRRPARYLSVAFFVAAVLAGVAVAEDPLARFIAQTPPRTPAEQAAMFHLPPGFEIALVASEPEVAKPINLNFDAAGRLFVTQSVEYPFAAPPDRTPRDAIKLVTGAGRSDPPARVTMFAGGLNIPIGVTPIPGGVLGFSIPNLFRFMDGDGDGQSESRRPAYQSFSFGDTHGLVNGLTWWIDGWVYGCHGFHNTSTVSGADERPISMNSGNTFRLRPDGSHIEYFTHGQVNPFGMTFDPLGNLYTTDCHTKPIYMLLRGAFYPSFGKPHDGLGFGPEMLQHSHGSTGLAGIAYYSAPQFPPEFRDTIFVGNPITGRVNHDRLERRGSTYQAIEQPDFVRCDDPWFRPVALQVGPDGSLYIADFYNPIIGHYEVPLDHPLRDRERGRIWRVDYVGTDDAPKTKATPTNLARCTTAELLDALREANLVRRTLATHQLVHRIGPPAAVQVKSLLSGEATATQRAHGLWVLARLGALDDETVRRLADDPERLVRVHLVRAMAEIDRWKPWQRRLVLDKLQDKDPFVCRVAAEAVGRHPHPDGIDPLLALWPRTPPADTPLVHTIRIALRDTIASLENLPELAQRYRDNSQRLEQLVQLSLGIHSPQAAAFLLEYHERNELGGGRLADIFSHMARQADAQTLPRLHQLAMRYRGAKMDEQLTVIRALHRAAQERGDRPDGQVVAWADQLTRALLSAGDEATVRKGIPLAREMKLSSAAEALTHLAGGDSPHAGLRPTALNALVAIDLSNTMTLLEQIVNEPQTPAPLRNQLILALGSLDNDRSRKLLVEMLKTAPENRQLAVAASLARSRDGGTALLESIEIGAASRRLLQSVRVSRALHERAIPNLPKRIAKLVQGLPPREERLQGLIASRAESIRSATPDVSRGAELFEKNCATCHQIAGKGSKVGPELDGVGLRGLERLLEDVLDPHRNVDAKFRLTNIVLADGRLISGLVIRQQGQVLIVADQKGQEQRIPLAEIDEHRESQLSAMPSDVDQTISEVDFPHLLGFLLSQRRADASDAK